MGRAQRAARDRQHDRCIEQCEREARIQLVRPSATANTKTSSGPRCSSRPRCSFKANSELEAALSAASSAAIASAHSGIGISAEGRMEEEARGEKTWVDAARVEKQERQTKNTAEEGRKEEKVRGAGAVERSDRDSSMGQRQQCQLDPAWKAALANKAWADFSSSDDDCSGQGAYLEGPSACTGMPACTSMDGQSSAPADSQYRSVLGGGGDRRDQYPPRRRRGQYTKRRGAIAGAVKHPSTTDTAGTTSTDARNSARYSARVVCADTLGTCADDPGARSANSARVASDACRDAANAHLLGTINFDAEHSEDRCDPDGADKSCVRHELVGDSNQQVHMDCRGGSGDRCQRSLNAGPKGDKQFSPERYWKEWLPCEHGRESFGDSPRSVLGICLVSIPTDESASTPKRPISERTCSPTSSELPLEQVMEAMAYFRPSEEYVSQFQRAHVEDESSVFCLQPLMTTVWTSSLGRPKSMSLVTPTECRKPHWIPCPPGYPPPDPPHSLLSAQGPLASAPPFSVESRISAFNIAHLDREELSVARIAQVAQGLPESVVHHILDTLNTSKHIRHPMSWLLATLRNAHLSIWRLQNNVSCQLGDRLGF